MTVYTIQVTLTDAETDEKYTEIRQDIFDSFNADEFQNVVEQMYELVAFAKKHYDCEETYELDVYILDENNIAIY